MTYSDENLLKGLKEQKVDCIRYLYKNYFPVVKSIVIKNSGSYEDAEDLFQDGLIALYHKSNTGKIILNCNLKTFFYSICKNLWLQRLERKWRLLYQDEILNEPAVEYDNEEHDFSELKLEKMRLFHIHFLSLPEECQKVLTCFIAKIPLKEIAKLMDFKNEIYAKQRKYLCKNMLRRRIKNDPRSKWLFIYDRTRQNP